MFPLAGSDNAPAIAGYSRGNCYLIGVMSPDMTKASPLLYLPVTLVDLLIQLLRMRTDSLSKLTPRTGFKISGFVLTGN